MPFTPPTLTPPPTAPNRDYPATFRALADIFLAWFAVLYSDLAAVLANVFANATEAYNSAATAVAGALSASGYASAAAASANAAASSAGAAVWTSRAYTAGESAKSPSSLRIFTARNTGAKPTDPAADPANWKLASSGGLPDSVYTGTTANVFLGERSRSTNVAATQFTVPVPTVAGEEWAGIWENGLTTNSFDIGAANLRHNGVTLSGVITNSQRIPIQLVSVGANEWRFA